MARPAFFMTEVEMAKAYFLEPYYVGELRTAAIYLEDGEDWTDAAYVASKFATGSTLHVPVGTTGAGKYTCESQGGAHTWVKDVPDGLGELGYDVFTADMVEAYNFQDEGHGSAFNGWTLVDGYEGAGGTAPALQKMQFTGGASPDFLCSFTGGGSGMESQSYLLSKDFEFEHPLVGTNEFSVLWRRTITVDAEGTSGVLGNRLVMAGAMDWITTRWNFDGTATQTNYMSCRDRGGNSKSNNDIAQPVVGKDLWSSLEIHGDNVVLWQWEEGETNPTKKNYVTTTNHIGFGARIIDDANRNILKVQLGFNNCPVDGDRGLSLSTTGLWIRGLGTPTN